MVAVTYL